MPNLTLAQAKELQYGDILCQTDAFGSDGMHRRWKVAGMVKTWKRDETRIRVPLKHGLRSYDAIVESDFHNGTHGNLCRAADCDCGNA